MMAKRGPQKKSKAVRRPKTQKKVAKGLGEEVGRRLPPKKGPSKSLAEERAPPLQRAGRASPSQGPEKPLTGLRLPDLTQQLDFERAWQRISGETYSSSSAPAVANSSCAQEDEYDGEAVERGYASSTWTELRARLPLFDSFLRRSLFVENLKETRRNAHRISRKDFEEVQIAFGPRTEGAQLLLRTQGCLSSKSTQEAKLSGATSGGNSKKKSGQLLSLDKRSSANPDAAQESSEDLDFLLHADVQIAVCEVTGQRKVINGCKRKVLPRGTVILCEKPLLGVTNAEGDALLRGWLASASGKEKPRGKTKAGTRKSTKQPELEEAEELNPSEFPSGRSEALVCAFSHRNFAVPHEELQKKSSSLTSSSMNLKNEACATRALHVAAQMQPFAPLTRLECGDCGRGFLVPTEKANLGAAAAKSGRIEEEEEDVGSPAGAVSVVECPHCQVEKEANGAQSDAEEEGNDEDSSSAENDSETDSSDEEEEGSRSERSTSESPSDDPVTDSSALEDERAERDLQTATQRATDGLFGLKKNRDVFGAQLNAESCGQLLRLKVGLNCFSFEAGWDFALPIEDHTSASGGVLSQQADDAENCSSTQDVIEIISDLEKALQNDESLSAEVRSAFVAGLQTALLADKEASSGAALVDANASSEKGSRAQKRRRTVVASESKAHLRLSQPAVSGTGLYFLSAMLNHSCEPNAHKFFVGDVAFFVLLRSVKPGDEICHSYLPPEGLISDVGERSARLDRDFVCGCGRCTRERQAVFQAASANPNDDDDDDLSSSEESCVGCDLGALEEALRDLETWEARRDYLRSALCGAPPDLDDGSVEEGKPKEEDDPTGQCFGEGSYERAHLLKLFAFCCVKTGHLQDAAQAFERYFLALASYAEKSGFKEKDRDDVVRGTKKTSPMKKNAVNNNDKTKKKSATSSSDSVEEDASGVKNAEIFFAHDPLRTAHALLAQWLCSLALVQHGNNNASNSSRTKKNSSSKSGNLTSKKSIRQAKAGVEKSSVSVVSAGVLRELGMVYGFSPEADSTRKGSYSDIPAVARLVALRNGHAIVELWRSLMGGKSLIK